MYTQREIGSTTLVLALPALLPDQRLGDTHECPAGSDLMHRFPSSPIAYRPTPGPRAKRVLRTGRRLDAAPAPRDVHAEDLRAALDDEQLVIHYQAQVTDQNVVTGAEVLLRWRDPRRGIVGPAEFIGLAETCGLIQCMGHWVLHATCVQLSKWASRPERADLSLAVNVSASQFAQADFVNDVLDILSCTGANPNRLKLELTESVLLIDTRDAAEKMLALQSFGVRMSLDDFGTGYSSLAYLKRLPFDQIKIDQSFVKDILRDPKDVAIVGMVVSLARQMGLSVIAEGVEVQGQCDMLRRLGCHAYQGYLFGHPLALDAFEASLGFSAPVACAAHGQA